MWNQRNILNCFVDRSSASLRRLFDSIIFVAQVMFGRIRCSRLNFLMVSSALNPSFELISGIIAVWFIWFSHSNQSQRTGVHVNTPFHKNNQAVLSFFEIYLSEIRCLWSISKLLRVLGKPSPNFEFLSIIINLLLRHSISVDYRVLFTFLFMRIHKRLKYH